MYLLKSIDFLRKLIYEHSECDIDNLSLQCFSNSEDPKFVEDCQHQGLTPNYEVVEPLQRVMPLSLKSLWYLCTKR